MDVAAIIDFKPLYEREKKQKDELKVELIFLQLQVSKLTQMIFGSRSERFIPNPNQLTLDIKTETAAPCCDLPGSKKVEYIKTNQL